MRDDYDWPSIGGFGVLCICLFLGAFVVMPCFSFFRGCAIPQEDWDRWWGEDKVEVEQPMDYEPAEEPLED